MSIEIVLYLSLLCMIRLATSESSLQLRVCHQHKLFKDSIIGETSVSLRQLLLQNGGRLNSVPVTLPLTVPPQTGGRILSLIISHHVFIFLV